MHFVYKTFPKMFALFLVKCRWRN